MLKLQYLNDMNQKIGFLVFIPMKQIFVLELDMFKLLLQRHLVKEMFRAFLKMYFFFFFY